MVDEDPIHIGIIGGGPAGVSLCLQLSHALKSKSPSVKTVIHLFEKNNTVGVGLPYNQSNEDSFCINLPKKFMILRPGHYDHFADWLAQRTKDDSIFPPRYYFGQYAQEQLSSISKDDHFELKIYREHEVIDIIPQASNQYCIHAHYQTQRRHYIAHYIILATGHLPNENFSHLHQTGCQITPWDLNSYRKIPSHYHVGIVGTRLTAIDAVLKLRHIQHQGPISLFSRTGLLSSVRGEHTIPEMKFLIQDKLHNLFKSSDPLSLLPGLIALLEQEMSAHLPPSYNLWSMIHVLKSMSPLKRLQMEIRQAEAQQTTWQSVLSCFYQILFKLWPMIPVMSKTEFLKNHSSILISLLCSFPLEKAYVLFEMMREGQLQVHKQLHDIHYASRRFLLHCADNSYSCDHLILALGSGSHPEVIPLYARMLEQGIIKKHSLGGLSINLRTYQVHSENPNNSTLYALGDLIKGACFNMIEIGQVVEQGAVITEHILNQIN